MEKNGDILTEFNNYYPERYLLNKNNFGLVTSKMCKDDIRKSIYWDVPKSLRNDILLYGLNTQIDEIRIELNKHYLDLLTKETTNFLKSNDLVLPEWNNVADLYDFYSYNKMSLNPFISKGSFINGEKVLTASKTSFEIDACYSSSKSVIASESSLDTSEGTPDLLEENSSSSIEEIFCPITNNPSEVKEQYVSRLQSQHDLKSVILPLDSKNFTSQNSPQDKSCIPELVKKESTPICQRKDRAMPELLPTLICLDDDSIEDFKEESPAVVSIADSPEMPKLIPFSAEAEEAIRLKTECMDDNVLPLSFNKLTPDPKTIHAQRRGLTDSKYQAVDLQTCTRKLFPDNETVNIEHFKAKYTEYLTAEKNDEEVGFSFSSSFKGVTDSTKLQDLSDGIKQSIDKAAEILKGDSDSQYSESEDEDSDGENANNCKSENSDSRKSFTDFSESARKMKKTKEVSSSEDEKLKEASDSISDIRQPKVMLRRISLDQCSSLHSSEKLSSTKHKPSAEKITFEHCLPSKASDDDNSLTSQPECDDDSSNEGPEIEEIEGIRFFQFRSKRDMEEFNRKPMEGGIDMEMIVPTKTTDITQIKGWRNKYFAPDSQCHYPQSDDGNSRDDSSQNAKSVPMPIDPIDTKCLDFRNCLNDKTSLQEVKVQTASAEIGVEDVKMKPIETIKSIKPSSAMPAFISKELDDFLLNSSTLNVKFLEKLNPNIIPIPLDSTILGLGKLRKPDYELNTLAALKRRNMLNKLKEGNLPPKPELHSEDESVITLSSSDENMSDDDIPVAKLPKGKKRSALSEIENLSPVGSMKRRKSDESVDGSQRLVLRLTKKNRGAADGYKVSDISSEKHKAEDESSSSDSSLSSSSSSIESETEELPNVFEKCADGTSPIIKDAIFLKDSEPKLLEEFLNNLNMLGTSKNVAMLVQSNQSYFSKGPVLQQEMCSEALDALLTNKEFVDSKTKHTPKKKLKAWQKYLPKKLSKIQQQKITKVPSVPKPLQETENSSKLKDKSLSKITKGTNVLKIQSENEKLSNIKNVKASNSKENVELKKPDHSEEFSQNQKMVANDSITNVESSSKTEISTLKEVPKVRKRRSRSAIDLYDPLSIIERGKRSIRLPARYLDSAVLAAGTEWVSPIFVEDEKKSRKQPLDVLEKTTVEDKKSLKQLSEVSEKTSVEDKKTQKQLLEVLGKTPVTPETPKMEKTRKQLLNVLDKIMPVTEKSSDQPLIKKYSGNNVSMKTAKRTIKTINSSKKIKIDVENKKISEANSLQNPNIGTVTSSAKELYLLPICSCTPCSRTVSYKKFTKKFVCFNNHNREQNENKSKSNIFTEYTIIENVESQTCTSKDSVTSEIKLVDVSIEETKTQNMQSMETENLQSTILEPLKGTEIPNNPPSSIPDGLQSTISESIKESEISNRPSAIIDDAPTVTPKLFEECDIKNDKPNIVSENVQTNVTLANKIPFQKLPITIAAKTEVAGKIVFLLPYNNSGTNNALQNKVPILPKEYSALSLKGPSSTSAAKPPILGRKSVPESPSSPIVLKSPTSSPSLQSPPKVLAHSSVASNTPIVFKFPENQKSSLPLLYNSSQLKPNISGQVLNKTVNVVNVSEKLIPSPVKPNTSQQIASPQMVMTAYTVGGKVYLCQSVRADSENKSSPKNANVTNQNTNNTVALLSSDLPTKENLSSSATQNKPPASDLLNSTVKDACDVPLSSLETPPKKKSRKSPLSARVFKESPDNEKGTSDTEQDVDVDTVDEKFNPKTTLKKQMLGYVSESDASDVECDEIFKTNMSSLIQCGNEKSVKEKKRRLLIKKSFEKLKDTDPLFKNAHSCNEILDMAVYAVNNFKIKEMALRQAKHVLKRRNTELLEILACNFKGIKGIDTRYRLKKQLVTDVAKGWEIYGEENADVLSSLQKKTERTSVNSSPQVPSVQSVAGPAIVVSKQLDFEVEESPVIHETSEMKLAANSIITEEIELPHVQLRILEMPENEPEHENSVAMDITVEDITVEDTTVEDTTMEDTTVKNTTVEGTTMEETTMEETTVEETTVEETTVEETTVEDTIVEIKMDETQSSQEKEVNIQDNSEKRLPVEGGISDGNVSDDDDLLIIDLDISTPVKNPKVSSEKEPVLDAKPMTSPPPMREFPGLIPLFPPEFYEEDAPFSNNLSKFPPGLKSLTEDSPTVEPNKKSTITSKSVNITLGDLKSKGSSTDVDAINKFIIETATNQLNSLMTKSRKTVHKKTQSPKKPTVAFLNQTPSRNPIHRGCKDVKILHGVGEISEETFEEEVTPSMLEGIPTIPENLKNVALEEIVIDDSDDESMEVGQQPMCPMSSESLPPQGPIASIIEDIIIDDDSQAQNVVS